MDFAHSINSGFSRYFDFKGRSSRSEFWYWQLFIQIVSTILMLTEVLGFVFGLVMIIPTIALAVRRLHDLDKSGWWNLISGVPWLGIIVLIIGYCIRGTDGANRFGDDPLDASGDAGEVFS